ELEISGEEMRRGARVFGSLRRTVALGEVGGEALVEALDRDLDRSAESLDEALRGLCLLTTLAAQCQRQSDHDALGAFLLDQLFDPLESGRARRALDDA